MESRAVKALAMPSWHIHSGCYREFKQFNTLQFNNTTRRCRPNHNKTDPILSIRVQLLLRVLQTDHVRKNAVKGERKSRERWYSEY